MADISVSSRHGSWLCPSAAHISSKSATGSRPASWLVRVIPIRSRRRATAGPTLTKLSRSDGPVVRCSGGFMIPWEHASDAVVLSVSDTTTRRNRIRRQASRDVAVTAQIVDDAGAAVVAPTVHRRHVGALTLRPHYQISFVRARLALRGASLSRLRAGPRQ